MSFQIKFTIHGNLDFQNSEKIRPRRIDSKKSKQIIKSG